MQEEKKENNKNLELNVSIGYKNDFLIDNGSAVINGMPLIPDKITTKSLDLREIHNSFHSEDSFEDWMNENINLEMAEQLGYIYDSEAGVLTKTFDVSRDENFAQALSFDKIRKFDSSTSPYEYIKAHIMENKDKPEVIRATVSNLLNDLESHYDHSIKYTNLPHASETFSNVLNLKDGEEMPGLICGTIHQQVMTALQECGIEACCVSGGTSEANHATLIYKESDGKYIFNDYGSQLEIEANNIKDALGVINKNNKAFNSVGYYSLQENNVLFQEYAYKEESVFGHKMDKSDYNDETVADFSIASRPAVNANVEFANSGIRGEIGGRMVFSGENSNSELSATFAYQQKGETSNFIESKSYGADVAFKKTQKLKCGDEVQFAVDGIVTNVKGERFNICDSRDKNLTSISKAISEQYNNEISLITNGTLVVNDTSIIEIDSSDNYENKSDNTLFIKTSLARKTNLVTTESLSVNNTAKATAILGGAFRDKDKYCGDARIALEDGITVNNKVGNVELSNTASVGIVDDLNLSLGSYAPKLQLGGKFNLASSAQVKPSENSVFGAQARGYAVVTAPTTEFGASASIWGQQKLNNTKAVVFGSASVGYENQRLHMGNFNETTENNLNFGITAGVKVNPTTQVSLSYNQKCDKLNSTRNYNTFNMTFTKTF